MTIKVYKANDGVPPYKVIGGNVSYVYDDESKVISIYTGDTWLCNLHISDIIITYQPDEILVYEEWNDSKDQFGNKIGEIENNELSHEGGTYQKNIEKLYSWSDMANELTSRGIPHEVVRNLADVPTAIIMNRPIFNIFKFDDWLHEKFGDYESEKKSMRDMFNQLFGDDCDKIAYYFGIERK